MDQIYIVCYSFADNTEILDCFLNHANAINFCESWLNHQQVPMTNIGNDTWEHNYATLYIDRRYISDS
ncbi:MAG: hypothetical protein JSV81_03965 [Anaerolineales bacterium]|nr:MAG: hypothetical protein JSV81_03965 [Anaerolineales bacterium]